MQYKYCEKCNFEDFSSGRIFYHKAGITNFPVRLAQEIYRRCLSYIHNKHDVCIYDPCCGGGYLLTVLGFLNADSIKVIAGSDINQESIEIAKKNISLLCHEGLYERIKELEELFDNFNKDSHMNAIESANRLLNIIGRRSYKIESNIFQADILSKDILADIKVKADIVITDVPYGDMVSWEGEGNDMINILLQNIKPILKNESVVAVCSDKSQKINLGNYKRLEKQLVGKRKFEILKLVESNVNE